MQKAKLRNPDVVGMGVLVVGSFSISRIRYLLDVYYTSYEVGCQVKSLTTKARRTKDARRKTQDERPKGGEKAQKRQKKGNDGERGEKIKKN